MKFNDSDSEIALIKKSIEQVARESGVDVRVILCIIVQESGGNVRIPTTDNGVRNPGIMQSHNGVIFNPGDLSGSILQMIRDGTEGTRDGDGLKQNFARQGNWYAAFREYNSGSVNVNEMNKKAQLGVMSEMQPTGLWGINGIICRRDVAGCRHQWLTLVPGIASCPFQDT